MKLSKEERGFSAAELLVGIALLTLILAISYPTARANLIAAREAYRIEHVRANLRQGLLAIRSGVTDAQSFDAIKTVAIVDNNDAPYRRALETRSPKTRIKPRSNGIRFLILDPYHLLPLRTHSFRRCFDAPLKQSPATKPTPLSPQISQWLSISLGTERLLNQPLNRGTGGEICLDQQHDLSSENITELTHYSIGLIPIRDHYAIYLDSSKTLRRYSFITHENQPIATDVSDLSIEQSSEPLEEHFATVALTATLNDGIAPTISLTETSSIPRDHSVTTLRPLEIFR